MIGFSVVVTGVLIEKLNFSMWVIITIPLLLGMTLLLFFFAWQWKPWFQTYLVTWVYYLAVHILLSYTFKFDSLIPAWKLHS